MTTNELAQSLHNWWSSLADITTWEAGKSFANSAFTTALIGSLAGAFAGAIAAQRIAERSKHREELLREIRNTNAAIAVAFGICNSLLALKKQHVKGLKARFDTQKIELEEFQKKRKTGEIQGNAPFIFRADLRTLQAQSLPTDTLRAVVFERLSLVGRPLNLVMTLTQTAQSLGESLEKRNSLIEGYKSEFAQNAQDLVPRYFGLPYDGSHVNLDYPGTIEAISNQTDDGIFFSNLLCKDLYIHGSQLLDVYKKSSRRTRRELARSTSRRQPQRA